MKDLWNLMDPKYIEVKGLFMPRGGISIYPFAVIWEILIMKSCVRRRREAALDMKKIRLWEMILVIILTEAWTA